jgi:hypothetical protein
LPAGAPWGGGVLAAQFFIHGGIAPKHPGAKASPEAD